MTIVLGRTQAEIDPVLKSWGSEVKRKNRISKYRFVERLQNASKKFDAKCSSSSGIISRNGTS
ncbi:hypothetical protein [Microcoleus sp. B9-D4]|uniref:hypothetical protein n=1 Tax=Microcoleus sp. B9-D4 TaxID=2818711 RepID=UPI002FD46205